MPSPLEWRHVSGMYPFDVSRTVLHLVAAADAADTGGGIRAGAEGAARFQAAHGWDASCLAVGSVAEAAAAVARTGPDAVVLHGPGAGMVGRLAVRGRAPTVYRPLGGIALGGMAPWDSRAWLLWERWAARWTNLLVVDSAAAAAEAVTWRIRAPLLVAHPHDVRKQCAAVARAHAFGRPTASARHGGAA